MAWPALRVWTVGLDEERLPKEPRRDRTSRSRPERREHDPAPGLSADMIRAGLRELRGE